MLQYSELFGFLNSKREVNKITQHLKRFLKGYMQCARLDWILGQKGGISRESLEFGS